MCKSTKLGHKIHKLISSPNVTRIGNAFGRCSGYEGCTIIALVGVIFLSYEKHSSTCHMVVVP